MRRREFITLLGTAAAAWPLAARAQPGSSPMRRVGVLTAVSETDPQWQQNLIAFRQGLEKLGWADGRNVRFDTRLAGANADQIQPLVKDLIGLQPDVVLATNTVIATALARESRLLPIVFVLVADPVGAGLVASLARPGGNLTGFLSYEEGIVGKWLAMLKEIAPRLTRVALLANPKTTAYDYFLRAATAAAPRLALEVVPARVEDAATDIERAIEVFFARAKRGLGCAPRHRERFA